MVRAGRRRLGTGAGPRDHGEVLEKGSDVEFLNVGDIVHRAVQYRLRPLRNCREGKTGICMTVNPARAGAAYGYVDMGMGGRPAEYFWFRTPISI